MPRDTESSDTSSITSPAQKKTRSCIKGDGIFKVPRRIDIGDRESMSSKSPTTVSSGSSRGRPLGSVNGSGEKYQPRPSKSRSSSSGNSVSSGSDDGTKKAQKTISKTKRTRCTATTVNDKSSDTDAAVNLPEIPKIKRVSRNPTTQTRVSGRVKGKPRKSSNAVKRKYTRRVKASSTLAIPLLAASVQLNDQAKTPKRPPSNGNIINTAMIAMSSTSLWDPEQMSSSSPVTLQMSPSPPITPHDERRVVVDNQVFEFSDKIPEQVEEVSSNFYYGSSGQVVLLSGLTGGEEGRVTKVFVLENIKLPPFCAQHGFYFAHLFMNDSRRRKISKKNVNESSLSACFYVYCRLCVSKHLKSCSGGSVGNFQRHLMESHSLPNPSKFNLGILRLDDKGCVSYGPSTRYPWNHTKQQTFLHLLLQYLMDSNSPFADVERFSLKRLLTFLDPQVTLPSHATLHRLLAQIVETQVYENLKAILMNVDSVTLVVDIWSSKSNQGVLAVRCIFIGEDFKWHQRTLSVCRMFGSHTGLNVQRKIMAIIEKWNLEHKICYVVSDGGSNMVRALKDLYEMENMNDIYEEGDGSSGPPLTTTTTDVLTFGGLTEARGFQPDFCSEGDRILGVRALQDTNEQQMEDLRPDDLFLFRNNSKPGKCVAHTLQRVLAIGLQQVPGATKVYTVIRKTALFGRKRQNAREIIKEMVGRVLVQPGGTRWNSVVDSGWTLWQRPVFDVVRFLIEETRITGSRREVQALPEPLTEDIRDTLHEFLRISDPICKLTDRLQSDGITAHLVIPGIAAAYEEIMDTGDLLYLSEYRVKILSLFEEKMCQFVNDEDFILATVLCPYYKYEFFDLYFEDHPNEELNALKMPSLDFVKELTMTHLQTREENDHNFSRERVERLERVSNSRKCAFAKRLQERQQKKKETGEAGESDLAMYLKMDLVQDEPDVFWKKQNHLPCLQKKSKEIFSKPATSGLIERLFSLIADINTSDRANLNVKTMEDIILYKEYINIPKTYKDASKNVFQVDKEQLTTLAEHLKSLAIHTTQPIISPSIPQQVDSLTPSNL